jgi:hypothetical protein
MDSDPDPGAVDPEVPTLLHGDSVGSGPVIGRQVLSGPAPVAGACCGQGDAVCWQLRHRTVGKVLDARRGRVAHGQDIAQHAQGIDSERG